MPLNLNTNEVTGVDLNNTEVSEVRLNGQTVFSATQLFDFEDGTAQGLTINNFGQGGSFTVGSETNTPSGTFSANNIDSLNNVNVTGNIELPVSSIPFRVIFDVYMENSANLFQAFGVFGKTPESGFTNSADFEGALFFPSDGEEVFIVKDGSTTLTSTSINQPLNAQYKMDFDIDSSKNYTVSVSRGGTTQVSDSGTFSSASFNNPQIISRLGGGNVGKNLFDNIEIV